MIIRARRAIFASFLLIALYSVVFAPLMIPANAGWSSYPLAPGHSVVFQATGLPGGVLFSISGFRVNNGGHPTTYSTDFTTPNQSAPVSADSVSEFTYAGFPELLDVGGQYYELLSAEPASPFVTGAPGDTTTVLAIYQTTCVPPFITYESGNQSVQVGDPVTFTVDASGSPLLFYQWYKDNILVPGADQSTYSIQSATVEDEGNYHLVVTNDCGSVSSTPAELSVGKLSQWVTFNQPPSPAVFGTSFVVTPTASSGLPVDLVSSGSCSNFGYLVSMTSGVGACLLVASQPGDDTYAPAPDVARAVNAAKAEQMIDFPTPPSPAMYGTVFTVTLSATSGLPVDLTAMGGCTHDGVEVTMISGTIPCLLTATQAGDDNYNAAEPVSHTVEAAKADHTINFTPPVSPAVYGTTFTLEASSSSGLEVSFAVIGVCSIAGNEVTMTSGTGACTITASQLGNDNYNAVEPVSHTVEAAKADQAISFTPPASPAVYGTTFTLEASSSSGLEVPFAVTGVCTVVDDEVAMTSGTGNCTITASQSGDNNYNAAEPVSHTVEAAKADQTINVTPPVSPAAYGTTFSLEASASSGLEVSFSVSGVCTFSGDEVTMTSGTGNCTITASQAGDNNYKPAEGVAYSVQAARANQTITFQQPTTPVKYRTSFTVAPTSSSDLLVDLVATGSCSNEGYTVTITRTTGTCWLTASQSGDFNYMPATDVQHSVESVPNGNIVFLPLLFGR